MKSPSPLPDDLRDAAFDRDGASRAGVPQHRLRRRDIRRPFHGVQAVRAMRSLEERCRAYRVRMRPGRAFSHPTALRLHGLPLPAAFEDEAELHVCAVMPARAPTARGVVGHRIRTPPPTLLLHGLPVLTMEEAWAQMAPLLTADELIELADAILWRDPALGDALRAAADLPYRQGRARLARALLEMRAGSRSPGETRVRLLLTRAGVPEPELNASVELAPGLVVHPDLVWRGARVVLEYEGDGHRERQRFRDDIDRYARLQALGWVVIRVTADDLRGDRARGLVARVRAAVAR